MFLYWKYFLSPAFASFVSLTEDTPWVSCSNTEPSESGQQNIGVWGQKRARPEIVLKGKISNIYFIMQVIRKVV